MSRFLNKSKIGIVLVAVVVLAVASAVGAGAMMAMEQMDEPTVNDTEPVGNASTSTTVTDPAWVGGNTQQVIAYTSEGDQAWTSNISSSNNYTGGKDIYDGQIYYLTYDYSGSSTMDSATIFVLNQSDGQVVDTISKSVQYRPADVRVNESGTPIIIEDDSAVGYTELSTSPTAEYQYRIESGDLTVYYMSGNGLYQTSPSNYYGDWSYLRNLSTDMDTQSGFNSVSILESTDDYAVVLTENSSNTRNLHVVSRTASSNTTSWMVEDAGLNSRASVNHNGDLYIEVDKTGNKYTFDTSDESVTQIDNSTFWTNDFFRNLSYVGEGSFNIVADADQPSGITIQDNVTVEVFENGRLIWERTYSTQSERENLAIYGDTIDSYIGENYTVRLESTGYAGEYQNTTIQHNETTSLSYTLTYVGTGAVEVESVTNESGATIDGYDVQVYSVADDEVVASADNVTGSYTAQVTAQQDYQVFVDADGYQRADKTLTVAENNTTSTSFVLQEVETSTPTPTPTSTATEEDDDTVSVVVGSGGDSGGVLAQLGGLVAVVIGFIFFPFSITLFILFLLWLGRRRDDSGSGGLFGPNLGILLLVGMVAVAGVAPYAMGTASAQTDTAEYEPADLLVFTAAEDKSQSTGINNDVIALDAETGDEAWRTELYGQDDGTVQAIAVAWDNSTNQVYAVGMDPVDDTVTVFEIRDSTGNITDSEQLNISVDSIGTRAVAQNGTLVFSSEEATYRYDTSTNNLTTVYQYEEDAFAYDVGYDENDQETAEAYIWNDTSFASYVYDDGAEQRNFSTQSGVNQVVHIGDGWLYQQLDIYYLGDDGSRWNISASMSERPLLGADSSGDGVVFARVGDGLERYNQSNGNTTTLNTGLSEPGTVGKMQVDYRTVNGSATVHTYNTIYGQDLAQATQNHHYRIYDAETGEVLYSESIAYDSNYHQSVAIVYDGQETTGVVGGDASPSVWDYLGGQALIAIAVLLGTLIGLGILYLILRGFWNVLMTPIRIVLYPFKLVWRFVMWVL